MNSIVSFKSNKKKVIFVMGASGTGKSKLAIALAKQFSGEVINSDKIQVYKGLDILTNKVTESECQGVPHHLLGTLNDPDADFTTQDFCDQVMEAMDKIFESGHIPIIAGGSNTYIQALVEDPAINFRSLFDCFFIWVDVSLPVLFGFVSKRVDEMVEAGAVEELREMYVPGQDTSVGIHRAIGVPEIGRFLEAESEGFGRDDTACAEKMLKDAIQETKDNTCKLVVRQVEKIRKLKEERGWEIRKIDCTVVFEHYGEECCGAYWDEVVLKPSFEMVAHFLEEVDIGENGYVKSKASMVEENSSGFAKEGGGENGYVKSEASMVEENSSWYAKEVDVISY